MFAVSSRGSASLPKIGFIAKSLSTANDAQLIMSLGTMPIRSCHSQKIWLPSAHRAPAAPAVGPDGPDGSSSYGSRDPANVGDR